LNLRTEREQFFQSVPLNLKLIGWWPVLVSGLLLGTVFIVELLIQNPANVQDLTYPRRAVETIVPLAFALQVAFLLSPDNEPALELLLSYPLPLSKLFWDRAFLVGILHTTIALTASILFVVTLHTENILLALVRWLPAAITLGGVAVFTSQLTRQGTFGMLMATLYWTASLYGGDRLLKVWKWFWPFHIYLQPEKSGIMVYLLNRFSLVAIGLILTLLALTLLKNEDRLLGNR
jgi:hypothetical protein